MIRNQTPNILWLGDPDCSEPSITGGKAAGLSRLFPNYRIPPGFCVTVHALDRALQRRNLSPQGQSTLPHSLIDELRTAYDKLSDISGVPEVSVVVRSSAIVEDSEQASFAGQFGTFVNISKVDTIAASIVRCWASAVLPGARVYSGRRGGVAGEIRMAVLVQRFLDAGSCAVVFTANPLTWDRNEVVVNSNWGLGESIATGIVTPDTFVVDKTSLRIQNRKVAEKSVRTVADSQGTKNEDIPEPLRTAPSLTDPQISEVSKLAIELERIVGQAVDVECAYERETLYLLQCRPVTAVPLTDEDLRTVR